MSSHIYGGNGRHFCNLLFPGNRPAHILNLSGFTHKLTLKGAVSYQVEPGADARGNLTRIDNALDKMPESLETCKIKLSNLLQQQEAAKAEIGKPFPQEEELQRKSARLSELDAELNIGGKQPETA